MRLITLFLLLCLNAFCTQFPINEKPTAPSVDGNAIRGHIQKLASDDMQGRGFGGKGEELATSYIADFYRSIGLRTQFQAVFMIGIMSTVSSMKLTAKGGFQTLKFGDQFMGWSRLEQDNIP